DVDRDGALAAVGLRHAGGADIDALLDVLERHPRDSGDTRAVGELDLDAAAVARLYVKYATVEAFDRAAHPRARRLLSRGRPAKQYDDSKASQQKPSRHRVIPSTWRWVHQHRGSRKITPLQSS